ncbi:flagellar hook-length control protein FliK [Yersinia artesiana]|uniref:flagellar hook-length control protein FliK n=1 Tax=Yersinia artesiana TaxID=2890315 RepID=UPI001D12D2EC|nr:flagellar hook-length control protein FliK [Yersinia artesiana]
MIVKAIPTVSGMTTKSSQQPLTDALDFSATLEKKLSASELKSAVNDKLAHPESHSFVQENSVDELDKEEIIENVLDALSADIPQQEQQTDPIFSIDPQWQQLQQLVSNTAQGVVVAPLSPPAPSPAEMPAENSSDGATTTPPNLGESQGRESPSDTTNLLGQIMLKNQPQATSNRVAEGKQETGKIAAEQHDDFLTLVKPNEANQQDSGVTAVKPEITAQLPLTPDNRSSVITDISLRPTLSGANDISASPTAAAANSPAVLNQALGTPAWQQALSQQLSYFSRNGIHNAELRLHPEELGALQINLRLNSDQAQLHFVTENHQVRAALEAAMPHLRTSLAESGINLGQSSVGADSSSSWEGFSQSEESATPHHFDDESDDLTLIPEENSEINTKTIHYANGINTFA